MLFRRSGMKVPECHAGLRSLSSSSAPVGWISTCSFSRFGGGRAGAGLCTRRSGGLGVLFHRWCILLPSAVITARLTLPVRAALFSNHLYKHGFSPAKIANVHAHTMAEVHDINGRLTDATGFEITNEKRAGVRLTWLCPAIHA